MVHTMEVLEEKLQFRRNEEFELCWADSVQFGRTHGIDVPHRVPGPKQHVSIRVNENAQAQHFHQTMKNSCRVYIFFSVLDHALSVFQPL